MTCYTPAYIVSGVIRLNVEEGVFLGAMPYVKRKLDVQVSKEVCGVCAGSRRQWSRRTTAARVLVLLAS